MQRLLQHLLREVTAAAVKPSLVITVSGIVPARTKVGWDIICRVGDPRKVHDLIRVGAHCVSLSAREVCKG